eukprot:CAMPEP_0179267130 /NCGR_PEP_ID=MMETSP0797-20121207/29769_1 /TAXON_ID=47934 /ORGANISM="Dinophysis acuminata, Strain DAEP01" /LENGTH=316 /DNA_ID=CAMNT_0020975377 /DNA_START=80 /DNA_END=1030 /DNA_ORIENTATION=+
MTKLASVLGLAAVASTRALVTVSMDEPYKAIKEHIVEFTQHDSKPGSAVVTDWSKAPLFGGGEEWRGELGSQLLATLTAGHVMKACKEFVSVGNYSFCKHAMPKVAAAPSDGEAQVGQAQHEYTLPTPMAIKEAYEAPDAMLGLSFGISQPDTWSEVMGQKYKIPTKQVDKICLDGAGDASCQPLSAALQGREPHSTLVKLDVDGAEWGTLEWLLEHDDEVRKIRTLDVHVNLVKDTRLDGAAAVSQATMKQHIEVMKKLAKKFALVGSTVEGNLVTKVLELEGSPSRKISEPTIHTQGGLPLEQFTVSYMNWELL